MKLVSELSVSMVQLVEQDDIQLVRVVSACAATLGKTQKPS